MTIVGTPVPTSDGTEALLAEPDSPSLPGLSSPDVGHRPERHPWWRRPDRPAWSVPARAGIFGLAALLYTWDLARIGMGNAFYAAAVKSGTQSWRAFFFGSLDPGSFITVDKPPAALWVMELSGRIFGFSSWSMLLPEALAGVATVMVLFHLVRLWYGEPAAVLGSLALALTPVAVVIFRYNNPDAFLTLVLLLAVWAGWRAMETGKTTGLVLAGALVGLAFLTKSLAALIVVPALGLAYLCCGPPHLARRIGQLGWAALALVVSGGWWVAIVELWPKGDRPYIGGSTDNSALNLIFGYNGLSRITGSGRFSLVEGGQGVLRIFETGLGGQISWLIPLAVAGAVGGVRLARGRERTDREWRGWVLWGTALLAYIAIYDDASGIFHSYYTVMVAPAVAAVAGAGAVALWRLGRRSLHWAWVLPAAVVGTLVWADVLLARTSGYDPWLGPTVTVTGVAAALILFLFLTRRLEVRWLGLAAGALTVASVLAGPGAYSLTTLGTATGVDPRAGPTPSIARAGAATVSGGLVDYLERHQGSSTYLVAVDGSEAAASFILQSGRPVIAMGGYTGWDPAPTLGEFEQLVRSNRLRYVDIPGGRGGIGGDETTTNMVEEWIRKHGTVVPSVAYGGQSGARTLYDLRGTDRAHGGTPIGAPDRS